jgi:2-amino-4-hydroxy-6-hydroxymethyldihydropteridine diphosphokinase
MNILYIILGSNEGDKLNNLQQAIFLINKEIGLVVAHSAIYSTAPWGNQSQPDFFNQAICVETSFSAEEVLKKTLLIEKQIGRIRGSEKWMPRTMDIDILFYNDAIINTLDLIIPHPYIQDRKFVLIPMLDIASDLLHPILKKSIMELCNTCTDELEVKRIGVKGEI